MFTRLCTIIVSTISPHIRRRKAENRSASIPHVRSLNSPACINCLQREEVMSFHTRGQGHDDIGRARSSSVAHIARTRPALSYEGHIPFCSKVLTFERAASPVAQTFGR